MSEVIRYAIWHTPRSGSTLLCNLLHNIPMGGMADFDACGFFIGWDIPNELQFIKKTDEYFAKQETAHPSGTSRLAGTKLSMEYLKDLLEKNPTLPPSVIRQFIKRFDKHIHLTRVDDHAQAVSLAIASVTGQYVLRDTIQPINLADIPSIHRHQPLHEMNMQRIIKSHVRIMDIDDLNMEIYKQGISPLTIHFKDIIKRKKTTFRKIYKHITGYILKDAPDATILEQNDPAKKEWLALYIDFLLENDQYPVTSYDFLVTQSK